MAEYLRADYNDDENKKHGKEKIIWTYPNKKQIVLLRDTTCDAEVVITPEVDNGVSKSRSDDANIEKRLSVPLWKGGEGKEKHKLSDEIEKVLRSLNNKSRKSASFCIQPIGLWVFKRYFKCYLNEINKFYNDFSFVCSVEYLFLVIKDENLYQVASDVADVFLQDKTSRTPSKHYIEHSDTIDEDVKDPVFGTIKVSIHKGYLHEAQTDVLVNTISTNLDLKIGTISASLLSKGGIGLQKEISRNGKPAQYGRVIKTSSCQLRCKAVYHGALKPYHAQDDSVQIFEQFLHECLEQASNSKYKSIAFPAIGTGKLGYPSDMVANLMIRAVMELEKSKPKTSLKEVKFVIHRTCPEVYQAFQDQLRLLQSGHEEEVNKRNDSPVSTAKSMKSVRPLLQQNPSSVQRFAPKTSSQSSKGSEGLVAGKTVHQVQTKKKCSFVLSGNIKDRKDLENRFSKGHQLKPKHIVCPYGDKPALLIFEKNVDIKVLRSLLKPFKIKQLPSEESKFLVLDGLMERLHNAGQEKMVLSNLQNFTGVEVTRQDNKVYLIGVTTGQIDIAKDYLEEFVKGLNIPMNEQSDSTTTSDVLDEEWDNQISTLKNVSEVEFKALMILEHGFDRIKNVELSWHDDAIIIDRQSSDTSVLAYLTSQLKVLRNKQSVEIALDEEEKKIVKDVMKDVHSEDIVCVYDEAKCLVVVYSDKQDNIMKFKHKLKFQTGKLKESVRNRKRFAENTQLSEISMQNFNSSFRSAEIGEDFAWSKGEVDKFYTKENIKVSVYTADILNLPVDCIVNAANDRMQHGGGVARVIADAAGPDLIQEGDEIIRRCGRIQVGCQVTTTPGRLPYKCVIHTVGPCWSDYQPHDLKKVQECEENLYASIYGCFQEAERMGLSSIALPAVSSGIYAVPKKMCAVQYAKAVLDYSQTSRQGQALKEIHFIDKLPDLVKLMQDTFRTMIQEGKVPDYNIHNYVASSSRNQRQQSKETGRKGNRNQLVEVNHCQYENTEPEGLSPVYYEQGENNKGRFVFQVSEKPVVFIYEGDILKLKHIDAIVCPDDSEGTSRGRIASELKKNKNYSKTKDMCFKQRKPNLGDLVIIDGKEIPKVIVHVVLENNSPRRQEFMSVIQKSFDNILRQMNEWENVKTIAMPLFGVKRELLTQKMWAETFLDRFVAFCCKVKNPSLEEVHIIAHFSSSSALSAVKKVFTEFADKVNKKVPPPKPLADEFNKSPSHHKVPPARPPSPEMYSTCDDTDEPMSGQENESENGDTDDSCTICMCLKTDPKSLSCGHSFCSECINQMLKHKPVCAICGNIVGIITGNQPEDGSMSVKTSPIDLAGYEGHGCIEITYDFPAGRQGPKDPSPGARYRHLTRTAYLPNIPEGRNVCRMLVLAFNRRLVFTISQSHTTGKEGLTWNDIHHKTNHIPGAQFGYPDPEYLTRVKEELSAKGITEADLPPE